MDMPISKRFLLVILPVIASVLLGVVFYSSESEAAPSITWNPSSVNQIATLGETILIPIQFVATKDIESAELHVISDLSALVSIAPSPILDIENGEIINLEIKISVPTDMKPSIYEGTIHLRNLTKPNKTFAKPLPVTIVVEQKGKVEIGEQVVVFDLLDDWSLFFEERNGQANLFSMEAIAEVDAGNLLVPPDITVSYLPNPDNVEINEFAASYDDSWFSFYAENELQLIEGYESIIFDDTSATFPHVPTFAAFIALQNNVLFITGRGNRNIFNNFLSTFELP